jgi:hypothetical protein
LFDWYLVFDVGGDGAFNTAGTLALFKMYFFFFYDVHRLALIVEIERLLILIQQIFHLQSPLFVVSCDSVFKVYASGIVINIWIVMILSICLLKTYSIFSFDVRQKRTVIRENFFGRHFYVLWQFLFGDGFRALVLLIFCIKYDSRLNLIVNLRKA